MHLAMHPVLDRRQVELPAAGRFSKPGRVSAPIRSVGVSPGLEPHLRTLWRRGEGFEPPDLSVNGFQDRRHKPLGHLSGAQEHTGDVPNGGFNATNGTSRQTWTQGNLTTWTE